MTNFVGPGSGDDVAVPARTQAKSVDQFESYHICSGMGTTTSSCRVEEAIATHYDHASVLEEQVNGSESFRLYRITSYRYEAILYNPQHSPNCFSLYRIPEEAEARIKFK